MAEGGEEQVLCTGCEEGIAEDGQYECGECGNIFCGHCIINFENTGTICKNCIDEAYPREKEIVEKAVEKAVKVPKEAINLTEFSEPIL